MDKTLLIDGDIVLFKLAFRHQEEIFGETVADDLNVVIADLDLFLNDLIEDTHCVDYIIALSSWRNFRKDLDPNYKIARKTQEKPQLLGKLRAYVETQYATLTYPGLEADDVMGILASQDYNNYIIASTDKDLNQIPGLHYDWRNQEFYKVDKDYAKKFFYRQVLSGDPADGYKGVPGIGKIKARRIIEGVENHAYWSTIVGHYKAAGLTEEDALLNARLAFILDKDHWDEEHEEVILWTPEEE